MAEIVLAITEGPLAVLPRLPPVDVCELHDEDVSTSAERAIPDGLIEDAPHLEGVTIRRVVLALF